MVKERKRKQKKEEMQGKEMEKRQDLNHVPKGLLGVFLQNYEVDAIIISSLQMGKLRCSDGKTHCP